MKNDQIECRIFGRTSYEDPREVEALVDFLHTHLGKYGDTPQDIRACLDYAFSSAEGKGGLVCILQSPQGIVGASVVNHTGMGGYIPSEQLVFIAVHSNWRGKGLGKKLLQFTLDQCPGEMALHVEYDNPARHLYASLGFVSKYAEMRRPAAEIHG